MWQLSEAVDGMAEACRALGIPVVGGNVSLYNESRGATSTRRRWWLCWGFGRSRTPPRRGWGSSRATWCCCSAPSTMNPPMAGSLWAWNRGHRGGRLPQLDLAAVDAVAAVVRDLVADGAVSGVHDVSEGGLALCLAEMAARSGVGLVVHGQPEAPAVFAETAGRVVICVAPAAESEALARAVAGDVPTRRLGMAGGHRLRIGQVIDVAVAEVVATYRNRLPDALGNMAPPASD